MLRVQAEALVRLQRLERYGTSAQSTVSSFSDKLGNSASHTMLGNVEYVPNVQNGLGAMFIDRNT